MKNYFVIVCLLLVGCASQYVVPANINSLSNNLSYDEAVKIVDTNFQLNKSTKGYGLCMGLGKSGGDWLINATNKSNFKIDKDKAQFSVDETVGFSSQVVRTGTGPAVASGRVRQQTKASIIFKDIARIDIDKVSWNQLCGMTLDSGFVIRLTESDKKWAIVVIREDQFDEFMAAIIKLNSNKLLKIYE